MFAILLLPITITANINGDCDVVSRQPKTSNILFLISKFPDLLLLNGNMDFELNVRFNYKVCLTALNIDDILVLGDPSFFHTVKISRVLFSQCETSELEKYQKTRKKSHIHRQTIEYPLFDTFSVL